MRNRNEYHKAATLLELVIVTTIIAALLFVAFPSFQKLMENSRAVTCVGRLNALGTAISLYRNDNAQYFPAAAAGYYPLDWGGVWYKPSVPSRPNGHGLAVYTAGQHRLDQISYCPTNRSNTIAPPCVHPEGYPYVMNYFLVPSDPKPLRRFPQLQAPAQTVIALDSQKESALWGLGVNGNFDAQGGYRIRHAHAGKANVLWADGHVSAHHRNALIYANFTGDFP